MSATLKDIALACGVHPSTVSRVLRGKENLRVSEETRRKIFRMAESLHYQPDQTARSLRLKKSNAIGMIIPNLSSPYFSGIAKTIDKLCSDAGYTLVICDTNEDQDKEINAVNDLHSRGVDGMIIAPVQESDDHIRDLVENKFPFVVIDRCFDDFKTNAVISNDEESAFNAVAHLAQEGHRTVGFVSGHSNLYPVMKRLAGYKRAIREYNLCHKSELISSGNHTLESGYNSMQRLLSHSDPPSGLIISGTVITLGVIKDLMDHGLSIPGDISIIGFTDAIYAPYLICSITTVSHQVEKIGTEAFGILYKQLESVEQLVYTQVVVDMCFNLRKSTQELPLILEKTEH